MSIVTLVRSPGYGFSTVSMKLSDCPLTSSNSSVVFSNFVTCPDVILPAEGVPPPPPPPPPLPPVSVAVVVVVVTVFPLQSGSSFPQSLTHTPSSVE